MITAELRFAGALYGSPRTSTPTDIKKQHLSVNIKQMQSIWLSLNDRFTFVGVDVLGDPYISKNLFPKRFSRKSKS